MHNPPLDPQFVQFAHAMLHMFPWILLISISIPSAAFAMLRLDDRDTAENWETVYIDDQYLYQQHKTKKKRRVRFDYFRKLRVYDPKAVKPWLKYKSDDLAPDFVPRALGSRPQ